MPSDIILREMVHTKPAGGRASPGMTEDKAQCLARAHAGSLGCHSCRNREVGIQAAYLKFARLSQAT